MRTAIFAFGLVLSCCLHCYAAPGGTALLPAKQEKLVFVENKGQITDQYGAGRKDIDLKLDAGTMMIFIGNGAIHYQWSREKVKSENEKGKIKSANPSLQIPNSSIQIPNPDIQHSTSSIETYRMDVELVGANKNAMLVKDEQQRYEEHYYMGHCSRVTAGSFTRITYKNIYPFIDWVLYRSNGKLKYDFIVHPGGNPADIRLRYDGATSLSLKDGVMTAATPFGSITEQRPYSYLAETKEEVASAFILLEGNMAGFSVAPAKSTLVIDPVLEWGTYLGGAANEFAYSVVTDSASNVYIAGETSSPNLATSGAHKTTVTGAADAYIAKFDNQGQPVWRTYYGGESEEAIYDMAGVVDGRLFVTGYTESTTGIATAGAHQQVHAGDTTILFTACFSDAGQQLWGTYYPSIFNYQGDIACDRFGNVYMAGETVAQTGIATPGSYQQNNAGMVDLFIVKFDKNGSRVWGSYYGTSGGETLGDVAVDKAGNIIIAGSGGPGIIPVTPGSHQPAYGGGASDAFIMKLDASGSPLYCSYYGGGGSDIIFGLHCDAEDNFYLLGFTTSFNDIASTGAHQTTYGGNVDAFLVKFNAAGARQWATYYGGSSNEYPHAVVSDKDLNVFITGWTSSGMGVATPGAHADVYTGSIDGFLAKFGPAGDRLWGSYYGGTGYETGRDVVCDPLNNIIICGETRSATGIASPGAFDATYNGLNDAFVARFYDTVAFINQPFNDTMWCLPFSFAVPYTVPHSFNPGNVFTVQLSDSTGSFASPANIGSLSAHQSGAIPVTIPPSTVPGNGYRLRLVASSPAYVSGSSGINIRIAQALHVEISGPAAVCSNDSLLLTVTNPEAGTGYQWITPAGFTGSGPVIFAGRAATLGSGQYVVTANKDGCIGKDTIVVLVKAAPTITGLGSNSPTCTGSELRLNAEAGTAADYWWYGPDGMVMNTKYLIIPSVQTGNTGKYYVLLRAGGCVSDTGFIYAEVVDFKVSIDPVSLKYPGDSVQLTGNAAGHDSVKWSWTGPAGFYSQQKAPVLIDITKDQGGDYMLVAALNGCSDTATIRVHVSDAIVFTLYPNPNNGRFTISGNTLKDQLVNFEISDAAGRAIYRDSAQTVRKRFNKIITLPVEPAAGVYLLRFDVEGKKNDIKFVIMK